MDNNMAELSINLALNGVQQGDDVFIHGCNLPENYTVEQFAEKLFAEGLRKGDRDSILSTIALIPHNRQIEDAIHNYVGRGKYRVILKIPEEVDNLFLGKCARKYGDAGNQYTVNSVLDLLKLPNIPPEFIIGIVHTDKQYYEPGEFNPMHFIQNPGFYDNFEFSEENSQRLVARLMEALDNSPNNEVTRYLITGEGKEIAENIINAMMEVGSDHVREKYGSLLEQRNNFEQRQEAMRSNRINSSLDITKEFEELSAELQSDMVALQPNNSEQIREAEEGASPIPHSRDFHGM